MDKNRGSLEAALSLYRKWVLVKMLIALTFDLRMLDRICCSIVSASVSLCWVLKRGFVVGGVLSEFKRAASVDCRGIVCTGVFVRPSLRNGIHEISSVTTDKLYRDVFLPPFLTTCLGELLTNTKVYAGCVLRSLYSSLTFFNLIIAAA